MKKLFLKMKKQLASILLLSVVLSITSFFAVPAIGVSADSPQFNHMDGDAELLRGTSENGSVYTDPVSGFAGDTFKGLIYYHNGNESQVAANDVNIKINLPGQTQYDQINDKNYFKISAAITASNMTGSVTDTIVNNQIVGQSGLTTNLDAEAKVEFISNSVRWYPENAGLNSTPFTLPGGQTGDEITGNGVSLGNIDACWNHSGYITFLYRTVKQTSSFKVDKYVKNTSLGENSWKKETSAKASENVSFKIDVENNGNTDLENLALKDSMPGDLTFTAGTLAWSKITSVNNKIGDADAAKFFSDGYNIAKLIAGDKITFTYNASTPASITTAHTVVNNIRAIDSGTILTSTASVALLASDPATITKSKTAKNITSGSSGTKFDAKESDVISYTLTTSNTGGAAAQVTIKDGVMDILDYTDVTEISDNGSLVSGTTGNDEKIIQYPEVTINPGQTIVRTFKVKVKNILPNNPQDGYRYDRVLYNNYGNDVTIDLPKIVIGNPVLKIDKKVRNFTLGEKTFVDSNKAYAGDTLEYLISFSNDGNTAASYPKIKDTLPSNVEFLRGTTIYSFDGDIERTLSDGVTDQGITFNTLQAGSKGYIKFKAITSSSLAKDEKLINKASISSGVLIASDTAETLIDKNIVPVKPDNKIPSEIELPKTGPVSAALVFLLTFSIGLIIIYKKNKQELDLLQAI